MSPTACCLMGCLATVSLLPWLQKRELQQALPASTFTHSAWGCRPRRLMGTGGNLGDPDSVLTFQLRRWPRSRLTPVRPPSSYPWTTTGTWIWIASSLRSAPSTKRLPWRARLKPRPCTRARWALGWGRGVSFLHQSFLFWERTPPLVNGRDTFVDVLSEKVVIINGLMTFCPKRILSRDHYQR